MKNENILLAVTGLSPQVVTETLYALLMKGPECLPSRVKLLTTQAGATRARLQLLDKVSGKFHAFVRDYQLDGKIQFNETDISVISDKHRMPMQDIVTPEDNACAADAITQCLRDLTHNPNTHLHVSIAGGRKTMGFYLGYAFSLFARQQDVLSHVLVSSPFESNTDFFYPPPKGQGVVLYTPDKTPIHTDDAKVWLAEIPVVKLRSGMAEHLLTRSLSFGEAVELTEQSFQKPSIKIDPGSHLLQAGNKFISLTDIQLVLFTHIVLNVQKGSIFETNEEMFKQLIKTGRLFYPGQGESEDKLKMFDMEAHGYDDVMSRLLTQFSKIKRAFKEQVPSTAHHYQIIAEGKKPYKRYKIGLHPDQITIDFPVD